MKGRSSVILAIMGAKRLCRCGVAAAAGDLRATTGPIEFKASSNVAALPGNWPSRLQHDIADKIHALSRHRGGGEFLAALRHYSEDPLLDLSAATHVRPTEGRQVSSDY
jgi:hypothetical protein